MTKTCTKKYRVHKIEIDSVDEIEIVDGCLLLCCRNTQTERDTFQIPEAVLEINNS